MKPADACKVVRTKVSCLLLFTCHVALTIMEEEVDQALQHLLQKFKDVFAEPKTLPPTRNLDHGITHITGKQPVNVLHASVSAFLKKGKLSDRWQKC